ncbi:unnamed protein product [Orchesella dallaii]|uniref:Uncharacterized protein n=1 Tax=Orchesella dallaii TaxID=48710 RepID=A0ABP1QZ66_9HEXA
MVVDGDRPTVLSVQKYESGPPVDETYDGQLVSSDGDTIAATKQEEWIKKKKVELTTTKQIETRVKRQIVLEDGKVVDDSGPIVTTNTTEDTDKKESEKTEHLTHGDDMEGKEGWVVVEALPDEAVVKETNERKVTTHDEVEDIVETEEVQHYGDVSNEEILRSIREGATVRKTLLSPSEKKELLPFSGKDSAQKRVLQQSRRHDRTTDIEDTKEVSKVKENGNVVTEITRRHEHEVFHNEDIPDSDSDEFEQIENREGAHDYSHGKSENFIEYLAVPKGGSPSQGVKDLRNRHQDDVIRSVNSQIGRVSVTKSGSLWDDEPTPTPPPRSRRRNNSPDFRTYADQTRHVNLTSTMNNNNFSSRKYTNDSPSYLQKSGDVGERKNYERREQSFGYNGPVTGGITRDSVDSGNFGNPGYVTKHSNQYKMNENTNPGQNVYYDNGDADVSERKTVERRERVFSYDGASQKQFHPKYIVGTPSSTMNRLKGIEHTGAVIDNNTDNNRSQTLPRRRFYFGDDEGSLMGKDVSKRSAGKSLRFGTDDIDVSISNSYQNAENNRKSNSLSRSMSFTPRSVGRDKPTYNPPRLSNETKYSPNYKSNPQLLDGPDLLTPKLLQNMSRSTRDVSSMSHNDQHNYSSSRNHHYESNAVNNVNHVSSKSKRSIFDSLKKNSVDLFEPGVRGSKASSPSRSMTPTGAYSPLRNNDRSLISTRASLQSPRHFGGANSPLSDDYHETYRMSSSTPDQDETKPKIKTDTTSKFSRKTIRGDDGRAIGNLESSQTTTRTTSRYKESEVMYPNGRGIHSPLGYHSDISPQQLSSGTVVIPVRDTNNNKNVHYAK